MDKTLETIAGTSFGWDQQLFQADGITPYTGYSAGATFTCSLTTGLRYPAITPGPTASWTDNTAGTYLLLVDETVSASLKGLYRLLVTITDAGKTYPAWLGSLSVKAAPGLGTATPPLVYTTIDDMASLFPSIVSLQDADADSVGFIDENAAAREWIENLAQKHYRGTFGIDQTAFVYFSDGFSRTGRRNTYLDSLFAASALILDQDVKDACACYALARVLRGQIEKDTNGFHQDQARRFGIMADAKAANLTLGLDPTGVGYATTSISLGSVDMLRG